MASKQTLTDEEIKNLWLSNDFPGHYSGINTLKNNLEYFYHVVVSKARLRSILKKNPNYQRHVRRRIKGQDVLMLCIDMVS